MRRNIFWAFLLILGAFVFSGQIAGAAPAPTLVREQNLDTNGFIKTHEQGTANVTVTNTPSVKIDPTSNTVQVASSQSNPLSVTNVNDGQNVYRSGNAASCSAGTSFCAVTLAPVSSGQRLVAETVSAHFEVPTGTVVRDGRLNNVPGVWLTPVKIGSDGNVDNYAITQQMRAYVGPAENVSCHVDFSAVLSADAQVFCTVEGYLVGAS